MNLQDQVLYRCVQVACARPLAHKVNFCPYCGAAQQAGAARPVSIVKEAEIIYRAPSPAPVPTGREPQASQAFQQLASQPLQPSGQAPEQVFEEPGARAGAPVPAGPAPQHPQHAQSPQAPPSRPAPRTAAAAQPPQPKPIRLRYWLMALALLALIWFYAKPDHKRVDARIDARIDEAIAMSRACKSADAQAELIALRGDKASPEQLQRLQSAINAAASACDKKKLRARTWSETLAAVDSALDDGDTARAQVRLAQFTKRYGDDAETRALKARIAAQREAETPAKKAAPSPSSGARADAGSPPDGAAGSAGSAAQRSQSSRNLIAEAERQIALGNYKAASDKLETCIAMVEGSRECAAYKVNADRLLRDMQRCLAGGRNWSGGRCL